MNKLITWNPIREIEEAQNRFNPFFLGGFPNRIGSGEIHSLRSQIGHRRLISVRMITSTCSKQTCLK